MTDNTKRIIEEQMNKDDETTRCELQKLQRWHHRLRKYSPEVEAAAGLDIERHQLLPNDPGGEQGKATGMGNQE